LNTPHFKIAGHIVDVRNKRIYKGELEIADGVITKIKELDDAPDQYILPGFIDAHVHIESSMLVPAEFARMAVVHGTVATVSDPHEIGNVLGVSGVEYMIQNGKRVPFKFYFGAPSCVPATTFETAGAVIEVSDVEKLLANPDVKYLAEMMNWPGVLYDDPLVKEKIASAQKHKKPVDGHAPGLRGDEAKRYFAAGISTDHECFSYEEGLDKLKLGVKVLIREGSAAKNFDDLIDLLNDYPEQIMFCSDDKHPDSLEVSHINALVKRAISKGIDLFKVLRAACINPIDHYGLDVGSLRVNDPADFIVLNDIEDFKISRTFIGGRLVAEGGKTMIESVLSERVNNFSCKPISASGLKMQAADGKIRVIDVRDGQLITDESIHDPLVRNDVIETDTDRDILKLVVVNRYNAASPAIAFVRNFGLRSGAIASSVAHDSHNIIAVGVDDESIAKAVNMIIDARGGISAINSSAKRILELPVAGLMTTENGYAVSAKYTAIDKFAKEELGSTLQSPFMSLSFMALLVIPDLKLSDKGLFSGKSFEFVPLMSES
jgi:adenine deaminase